MPERHPPDDPREWLNRARSDLLLAKSYEEGIYLEDLCFHAQQATEKAIKALLIRRGVEFPYVHDISELMTLLERAGESLSESIRKGETLTRFAVFTRYPGVSPPVSREEYEEALKLAEQIIQWVQEKF
jgi:HEPN domain-containing protein